MYRTLLLVLIMVSSVPAAAERLSAEVLWKLDRLSTPVISPDGEQVVVAVTSYAEEDGAADAVRRQASQGRQRAKLFELGAVINETSTESGGWQLEVNMAERDLRRFLKRENLAPDILEPTVAADAASAAH